MKQSFWNFTRHVYLAPESEPSTGGGTTYAQSERTYGTVSEAMAELDRRDAARRAERKAERSAEAKKAGKDDPDEGDEPEEDADPRRVKKEAPKADPKDKPEKKGKAAADDEADDEDDDGEEDSADDDASDDDAVTTDEDDEGADSEADQDADTDSLDDGGKTVEVEHEDGKKYRIPAALKDAFSRQSNYTRNSTQLAQERQVAQQTFAQAQQVLQHTAQTHQVLVQFAQAMLGEEPSPELAQSDPGAFVQQRSLYDARQKALQQLQSHGQQLQQHQQAMQRQQMAQHVQAQAQALLKAAPELRDPKKREQLGREVAAAAGRYGFTPEDLAQAYDHRMLLLLRDLARLQRGEGRQKQATENVKKKLANVPPRQIKPGTASGSEGKTQRSAEARAKFMRSGRTLKDVERYLRATGE